MCSSVAHNIHWVAFRVASQASNSIHAILAAADCAALSMAQPAPVHTPVHIYEHKHVLLLHCIVEVDGAPLFIPNSYNMFYSFRSCVPPYQPYFFHVANIFWANFLTRLCALACHRFLASTRERGTYVLGTVSQSIRGLWTMDDMVGNGMWYMNGK